jgi:hypothetical protein
VAEYGTAETAVGSQKVFPIPFGNMGLDAGLKW